MAIAALLLAAALPLAPKPAAPFPKIITDAPVFSDVAPGIQYGDYEILTADGPLSIHVLAVDLHNPNVRVGTALAQDRLVSSGETVSSMARRTGAVAGINGDYFDINQTNQPLNILVQNGRLVRMPMRRWAIAFAKDEIVSFAEFTVHETAALSGGSLDLSTMNDWPPPENGAVLVTPEYGSLRPAQDVTEIALEPVDGAPPFAQYRVASIVDNTSTQAPGYYLAIGPGAYGEVQPPNAGDPVTIAAQATPPLDGLTWAIGGGPLLVKDGEWYADPDGPSKGEFATHMPASAVAETRDGNLLFFEIDGRQPALSIGVLQSQLAALLIAFGARTGMQFDGGGSSTLVARLPGDTSAVVQNSPSDGIERRVADGLFVYSDAPYGPPARLYSYPQIIRALPGARVPLRIAITDAAAHRARACPCEARLEVVPAGAGTMDGTTFIAGAHPMDASIRVHAHTLNLDVPVRITTDVARAEVLPQHPGVLAGGSIALQVRAFDAHGYSITLPQTLPWHARNASIDERGIFRASASDGIVDVRLGDAIATTTVTVGEHDAPVAIDRGASFATAPHDLPGGISKDDPCAQCTTLKYDFTGNERAAYANASIALPQRALGLAADVLGDGNGETLRVAVDNAINERFLYSLATIDWHGWRRVELRFPPALPQPITLKSIYVIDRVGPGLPVKAAGSVALRAVRVLLAGSANEAPK